MVRTRNAIVLADTCIFIPRCLQTEVASDDSLGNPSMSMLSVMFWCTKLMLLVKNKYNIVNFETKGERY
jgi:hypothetical protein